ncbi:MAG: Crp/Fnr family transcriptional regulator [Coriobacteriales bacterium]|nr:Crp/Fnr family transcriptional regulator [Coriobacteriales bacterium]
MEAISIFVQPRQVLTRAVEELIAANTVQNRLIKLHPGEYLFHSGECIEQVFYLSRGMIRLSSTNPSGDMKTVFLHKAGTLIGFQTMQQMEEENNEHPSILDAEATAVCEVYALNAAQFRKYLTVHGDICYEFACYLFDMLANQTRESVNGSIYTVLERFAALLLAIARELKLPQAPAVVPFTNSDLASMLGVHPNSITNAITALRKSECVERQHGCLLITDYKKLKQIAGDLVTAKDS